MDGEPITQCEGLMKKDVKYVSFKDAAQDAARLMRDENIGFLPVCDESKKVLGTITDRDIATRLVAENKPATTPVGDLMTRAVVACSPKDGIERATELMEENHKSRVMCVDGDKKLVGVISLSDIAQYEVGTKSSDTLRKVSAREATMRE